MLFDEMSKNCKECGTICNEYLHRMLEGERNIGEYERLEECKLRHMPDEEEGFPCGDEYVDGYTIGWNDCLKEIQEEK